MIQIHRIKCGNANCYVLEENGNAILADTGKIVHQKEIEEKLVGFPIRLMDRFGNNSCWSINRISTRRTGNCLI